jgi:hypothetical protein
MISRHFIVSLCHVIICQLIHAQVFWLLFFISSAFRTQPALHCKQLQTFRFLEIFPRVNQSALPPQRFVLIIIGG